MSHAGAVTCNSVTDPTSKSSSPTNAHQPTNSQPSVRHALFLQSSLLLFLAMVTTYTVLRIAGNCAVYLLPVRNSNVTAQ